MRKGALIVFSGLDGAGKSTQIGLLMDRLHQIGRKHRYIWTRGGYTPLFERLKIVLRGFTKQSLPPSGQSSRRTQIIAHPLIRRLWLMLAMLDLMRVYGILLRWWRWRGQIVICDRYLWDTWVDFRLNFPQECVDRWGLWRFLSWITPKPDTAFLLLLPVVESVRRSDLKGEPFRDSPEVLAQRLAHYQSLAAEHGIWHILDGQRSIPDLEAEIWTQVDDSGSSWNQGTHPTQRPYRVDKKS